MREKELNSIVHSGAVHRLWIKKHVFEAVFLSHMLIPCEAISKFLLAIRARSSNWFSMFAQQMAFDVVESRTLHGTDATPVHKSPGGWVCVRLQELHHTIAT
jgi:hypothetical protein